MSPVSLAARIQAELGKLTDARVLAHVRQLLLAEHRELVLGWDYGDPDETYAGLLVLEHAPSRTGIAYCDQGFGPIHPWGLISTSGESDPPRMGMDSAWFARFVDAYFESRASADLPIWRVARTHVSPIEYLSDELDWEEAWRRIAQLRAGDPAGKYDCLHSIAVTT